jgi:hypothetical protein
MNISNPPADILINIILKLLEERDCNGRYSLWLVAAAGVNCRWRVIILSTPLLWTQIYGLPPSAVQLHLERSAHAPLTVNYSLAQTTYKSLGSFEGGLLLVLTHLHRIKSLTLHIPPPLMQGAVESLNADLAPLLEVLDLNAQSSNILWPLCGGAHADIQLELSPEKYSNLHFAVFTNLYCGLSFVRNQQYPVRSLSW